MLKHELICLDLDIVVAFLVYYDMALCTVESYLHLKDPCIYSVESV